MSLLAWGAVAWAAGSVVIAAAWGICSRVARRRQERWDAYVAAALAITEADDFALWTRELTGEIR